MANVLRELSSSLRAAVKKAAAYTVGLEREPYAVSGILIGGDRVLTASHLVPDEGIGALLPDGRTVKARVAGRDAMHDLVLLRLEDKAGFSAPETGVVEVGDLVVSLKRDPIDGINASLAMVSARGSKLKLGRSIVVDRYIQVDADRLPGTTGGPLADADGALSGILVYNRHMGAELVLPADLALERAALIEKTGGIRRPYLGIRSQSAALPKPARDALKGRQETGLLLVSVEKGSAAESAGLEVGDILVGVGAAVVSDHEALVDALADHGAGSRVEVEVIRGGALRTLSVTIGGV
jgi:S1-C subfamily serine protease